MYYPDEAGFLDHLRKIIKICFIPVKLFQIYLYKTVLASPFAAHTRFPRASRAEIFPAQFLIP
jgi:hypothetical protein